MRFSEFTEEWEVKELKEVCEINPKNSTLPNSFIYIDLESVINGVLMKENQLYSVNAPSRAQRILKKNDILFQMVRPYQKNNFFFHLDGNYVASTGYAQIRTQQDSQYIFQYLHNQKFVDKVIDRCTGTSYPAINSTDLSKIPIFITSIQEQRKISSLLKLTDCRIATQKKIIEQLKTLMRGWRERIFSQKVRFKNKENSFSSWEIKKLKDISIRVTTKNIESNKNVLTISAQYGLISQLDFFSKSVSAKNIDNYYLLEKNDFAYNKSYSNGYPMGAIKKLINYEKGVISTLYICFRFHNYIDTEYMKHYFDSGYHNIEIEKIAQEGARNHGLLNISISDFFNININLPAKDEQSKIANFLSSIQEKIDTEKQILEKLELQKKFLLANLFV